MMLDSNILDHPSYQSCRFSNHVRLDMGQLGLPFISVLNMLSTFVVLLDETMLKHQAIVFVCASIWWININLVITTRMHITCIIFVERAGYS